MKLKFIRIPILLSFFFVTSACATQAASHHADEGGLSESPAVNIPYESPAAALSALRLRRDIVETENGEWWILNDSAENSLWSITKPGHFAHPTAVLRRTFEHNGQVFIGMDVKCGSSKANCDRVVQQYIELNNKIKNDAKGG